MAKVLSTTTYAPASCAARITGGRSMTSRAGFVGDSSQTSAASSQAARSASWSVTSTRRTLMRPRASRSASCMTDAVVGVPRRHDGRAQPDEVEQRRDRREAGGEGQRAAALERAQRLLERRPGRVGVAAVLTVATGDVRRRERHRVVQRLVGLVGRAGRRDRDRGGSQRRRGVGRGVGHRASVGG